MATTAEMVEREAGGMFNDGCPPTDEVTTAELVVEWGATLYGDRAPFEEPAIEGLEELPQFKAPRPLSMRVLRRFYRRAYPRTYNVRSVPRQRCPHRRPRRGTVHSSQDPPHDSGPRCYPGATTNDTFPYALAPAYLVSANLTRRPGYVLVP